MGIGVLSFRPPRDDSKTDCSPAPGEDLIKLRHLKLAGGQG
jgi:hypothetical protein